MKKRIYYFVITLLLIGATATIKAQGLENFNNSNATSTYADNSFVGENGITWTYVASRDANNDANSSGISLPALMLRRVDEPSSVTSSTISGGVGDFSVKLYKGFTGGGDRQVELFVNNVSYGTSTPFDDYNEHIFTVTNINVAGDVVIRLENVTAKQVIVDDLSWTVAGAPTTTINITSPSEGSTTATEDVTVDFTVQNWVIGNPGDPGVEGHIHWKLDGVDQAMKYDTDPIDLVGLASGAHTVILKLVDNAHADLDPSVADTVNFNVPVIVEVSSVTDLRAGATDGTIYRLTSEVVLLYKQSYRNQKHIQDADAGILIDDNGGAITTSYNVNDGITGLVGTLSEYGGMMQLVPTTDPGAATSTGNTVTPVDVTLADLKNNFETYESRLIKVMNVSFVDGGSDFANGNVYDTFFGTDTVGFRTTFFSVDYIGTAIPDSANVVGIPNSRTDGGEYYTARDAADIEALLPPTANVTFRVNVGQEVGFDVGLGANLMGINGNWSLGDAMDDGDADLIYEVTLALESGDYEFKFRNGNDDNVGGLEWESISNRAVTVVAGTDMVLPAYCWNSTQECSDVATSITFKVDMNFSGEDLGSGVELMGSYNGWSTGTVMDDSDGDLVYEVTVDWQPNTYEYKFKTGLDSWESIGNRFITVIDGVPQVLPAVCWNSNDLCPYPGITITAPDEGSVSTSADVTVEFVVVNWVIGNPGDPGIEGHIHWTLDAADQPMKFDTDPIELIGLADGDHTVILRLVDNDHVDLDPLRSDTVTFNVNTTIVGGGMETFTNSNATSTYADGSYVGDNGITWNYVHSRDDNGDANGSGITVPALMLRRMDEPSSVFSESIPDGVGNFSVKLYKGFTGGGDRQVEVFINDVSYGVSVPFDDFDMHMFTVENINVPGDVVIRIDNITPKQVIVDDISWTGFDGVAVPGLAITSPTEGSTSEFSDLPVVFSVMNFVVGNPGDPGVEGHIHWTLDGGSETMKFDTDPIALTGLADGAHTVIMKLVDNDHADLDPSVADTVNFNVAIPEVVDVATMAELRAGNMDGTVYRLTGEAIITYEQSFRHQKYLQDATGAILIDDDPGVITTDYVRGDGMTNLTGTLSEFSGMLQFNPFVDPGTPSSTGNVITPEVVNLAELSANFANYESELILVEQVTFAIGGTDIFENGQNYDISDPSGVGIFRTNFFFVDYIETLIPQLANVTSLAIENNGTAQIVARDMADFDIIDAVNEIDKANFSFYPNPNSGQFTLINDGNNGDYLVELIDLTGKVVYSENISLSNNQMHVISVDNVVSGVYLVKLINKQDSYSRTMRMIIK